MPKSRNRKKKIITKTNSFNSMLDRIVQKICSCPECNNDRIYLDYVELAESQKLTWQNEDLENIDYFLYCMSCHEFSGIYNI